MIKGTKDSNESSQHSSTSTVSSLPTATSQLWKTILLGEVPEEFVEGRDYIHTKQNSTSIPTNHRQEFEDEFKEQSHPPSNYIPPSGRPEIKLELKDSGRTIEFDFNSNIAREHETVELKTTIFNKIIENKHKDLDIVSVCQKLIEENKTNENRDIQDLFTELKTCIEAIKKCKKTSLKDTEKEKFLPFWPKNRSIDSENVSLTISLHAIYLTIIDHLLDLYNRLGIKSYKLKTLLQTYGLIGKSTKAEKIASSSVETDKACIQRHEKILDDANLILKKLENLEKLNDSEKAKKDELIQESKNYTNKLKSFQELITRALSSQTNKGTLKGELETFHATLRNLIWGYESSNIASSLGEKFFESYDPSPRKTTQTTQNTSVPNLSIILPKTLLKETKELNEIVKMTCKPQLENLISDTPESFTINPKKEAIFSILEENSNTSIDLSLPTVFTRDDVDSNSENSSWYGRGIDLISTIPTTQLALIAVGTVAVATFAYLGYSFLMAGTGIQTAVPIVLNNTADLANSFSNNQYAIENTFTPVVDWIAKGNALTTASSVLSKDTKETVIENITDLAPRLLDSFLKTSVVQNVISYTSLGSEQLLSSNSLVVPPSIPSLDLDSSFHYMKQASSFTNLFNPSLLFLKPLNSLLIDSIASVSKQTSIPAVLSAETVFTPVKDWITNTSSLSNLTHEFTSASAVSSLLKENVTVNVIEEAQSLYELASNYFGTVSAFGLWTMLILSSLPITVVTSAAYSATKTEETAKKTLEPSEKTIPLPTPKPSVKVYNKDEIIEDFEWNGNPQSAFYVDTEQNKTVFVNEIKFVEPPTNNKETIIASRFVNIEKLCEFIVRTRIGNTKFDELSPEEQKKCIIQASYSAKNRPDFESHLYEISEELKTSLNVDTKTLKDIVYSKHTYSHNSEFNGYAYTTFEGDPLINTKQTSMEGKPLVLLTSAIASSFDREAQVTQNLSVIESNNVRIYTGRVETEKKAKEQALFMFEKEIGDLQGANDINNLLKDKKGFCLDPITKTITFTYVVHSTMSDSATLDLASKPDGKEKTFLKNERDALTTLKNSEFTTIDVNGETYTIKPNPILFSQSFNLLETFRGVMLEGELSPVISLEGWESLNAVLTKEQKSTLEKHITKLDKHFTSWNPWHYLDSVELFLTLEHVLQETGIPSAVHCKSSTDRTGIAIAYATALAQYKALRKPVNSARELLQDDGFKELFAINWQPWHQRSRYSRNTLGISFGKYPLENPNVLRGLPERYKQDNYLRFITANTLGLILAIPFNLLSWVFEFSYQIGLFGCALFNSAREGSTIPLQDFNTAFKNTIKKRLNDPICYVPLQSIRDDDFLENRNLRARGKPTSPYEEILLKTANLTTAT